MPVARLMTAFWDMAVSLLGLGLDGDAKAQGGCQSAGLTASREMLRMP